ncbi:hypothetical protein [Thalassospira lucentensis]|uniref:hypothetical protein n=1 Tax=Thalassospira lucentensis TaxID=168935 RepID=UPI0029434D39|nr:hypothetical protein [Thalassospira lucentensis]WOI09033.1 hypothetical protein R1T41_00120 [Thalassospira lucentensis]
MSIWPFSDQELCTRLEASETPPAAPRAILRSELLTPLVWDPACGRGICSEAAREAGYSVYASDIHDWGYGEARDQDFLKCEHPPSIFGNREFSIFTNAPFSLAVDFVEHGFRLGARKIVLFQRQGWLESGERQDFWNRSPYQRSYLCRTRTSCYWMHLSPEERASMNNGSTAYSWYVFERGQNCRFQADWIDYEEGDHKPMPGIAHSEHDIRVYEERDFSKIFRRLFGRSIRGKKQVDMAEIEQQIAAE